MRNNETAYLYKIVSETTLGNMEILYPMFRGILRHIDNCLLYIIAQLYWLIHKLYLHKAVEATWCKAHKV